MADLGYNGFPVFLNYFSGIPDPNLVADPSLSVHFKALQKKDPTTKEKALIEILKIDAADDAIITSWIQLYPKLAIDNSKNVRVLSHQVMGRILQVVGGKSLARYLKSCIPVWLMGTYENDKAVSTTSYKELLASFSNDKDKIDTKLWLLFEEPILQYCESVILIETAKTLSDDRYTTPDDSTLKYERVLGSAILMLNKVILLNQVSDREKVEHILKSDKIWNSLSSYATNAYLFKTILILIRSVFSGFLSNSKLTKDIHKTVSKTFFKDVKLKPSKTVNPILYSSFILQFWSTLHVLTKFEDKKCKKNFWQLGGSKSFNRLIDYLKLGSCSLDPIYYIILSNFFESLFEVLDQDSSNEDNEFLDFSSNDDADSIILKILCKQFTSLPLVAYRIKCLECILRVWSLFAKKLDSTEANKILIKIFNNVLEGKVNSEVLRVLLDSLKMASEHPEIVAFYSQSVCKAIANNDTSKQDLVINYVHALSLLDTPDLQNLLNLIENGVEDNEDLVEPSILFNVMIFILSQKIKLDINKFIEMAPLYIEQEFVDLPLKFLKKLVDSDYVYEDMGELVDDYFVKIQAVDSDQLLKLFGIQNLPISQGSEVEKYLLELSASKISDPKHSKILMEYLHIPGVSQNILSNSKDDATYLLLIEKSSGVTVSEEILQVCWRNIDNLSVQKYIHSVDPDRCAQSMRDFILSSESGAQFDKLLPFFNDSFLKLIQVYIEECIELLDVDSLFISNSLQFNIALVRNDSKPIINQSMLKLGSFISSVENVKSSKFAILCGILSEYILDFNFLNNLSEVDENLIQLRSNLLSKFLSDVKLDLGVAFEGASGSGTFSELISYVNSEKITMFSYYCARLLKHLFDNSISYDVTANLTKQSPLLVAAFLRSDMMEHFNKSQQNYDRLKNYAFAEILGVRTADQIMKSGLKWLTLSLNFIDEVSSIPPQRLTMVLNQLEKWLESEVAYDPEFLHIRVLLTIFFASIINQEIANKERVLEVANNLLIENLDTIVSTPESVSLRYFTFKLMNAIIKEEGGLGAGYSELLEILINKDIQLYDESMNNQAVVSCYGALQRVIQVQKPSFKMITVNLESFYSLVTQSHMASLQRIGVFLLHDYILHEQQEFVVEYQLQKSSLSEERSPIEARLPAQLLECITNYDTITYGKYLWSWLLILDHFKDITYSIRNSYILQVEKELQKLLDFIVYHVDLTNPGALYLEDYDILHDDLELDPSVLLFHLFYLCLKYLGSLTQSWLNGIRDRQLKSKIENFTVKNISPILIDEIFEDVNKSKDRVSSDLMLLKINLVTNEIKSTYVIDEQTMEMIIKIPKSYPLSNVTVDGPLRLGVNENQWKAWLLASQRIISLTNGSVLEAIETFNKNVSYHFSGFEECAICYSILHQDHSLPSKTCTTCLNKFHAACLYKWFKSSGGSTCPLCRTAFNFRNRS